MQSSFRLILTKSLFLLLLVLAMSLLSFDTSILSDVRLLEDTFAINSNIEDISMTMLMKEKVDGDYNHKKAEFKIIYNPYHVYLKQSYPNAGLEILYVAGRNEGKAIINRNAFAFSVVRINPISNTIRKEHHHSILKAGFSYVLDVFEHLYQKYDPANPSIWKYNGLVKYADIICHKITFESPAFEYISYTVKNGETLELLSRELYISDYMVYEKNPFVKSFESLKPGTTIKIPSDYGKTIILYIDKKKQTPVGVKIFDEEGLFEEYTYLDVQINPRFQPQDFDINNPEYGFR